MKSENRVPNNGEDEANSFVLLSQIANLKYANSELKKQNELLTFANDGLKNELRDKNEKIKELQQTIHNATSLL